MSVIIGSMRHEVNSFCKGMVDLEEFRHGYLLYGKEIEETLTGKREGESAFIDVVRKNGYDLSYTVAAKDASAGGPVTEEAFNHLKEEFRERTMDIVTTDKVEAVLLNLHGAMLAKNSDDPEGELVEIIRSIVGESVPIGVSLDAHAKITKRLVKNADIIIGYHTIPHIDAYETSHKTAELIMKMIRKEITPYMSAIAIPTLLPVEAENHNFGGYAHLVNTTVEWEKEKGVYSVTYFPGQPWMDYPGNDGSFVVAITDSKALSEKIVCEVAQESWDKKDNMVTEKWAITDAVKKALSEEGPVVITELGDAPPAGSIGDGNDLLKALLEIKPEKTCYVTIVDPEAVKLAYTIGVGNRIVTSVGWKINMQWGSPIEIDGIVRKTGKGDFVFTMGDTPGHMGDSAVIQIGNVYLIVCQYTFSHYDPNSYRCMGLKPEEAQILGVKSTEHFRAFYGDLAKDILLANTKGPSMSNFKQFEWKRKGHPIWPLDEMVWKADKDLVYGK